MRFAFFVVTLLGVTSIGCSHSGMEPSRQELRMFNFDGTPTATSIIGKVLTLKAARDSSLTAGVVSKVEYKLTNVGTERLTLCIDGVGVSTWVSSNTGEAKFPSTLYSIAFDAPCNQEIRLNPRESRTFSERLVVPVSFSPGPATLHGTVPIKWPLRGVEEVLATTFPLDIATKH